MKENQTDRAEEKNPSERWVDSEGGRERGGVKKLIHGINTNVKKN